MVKNIRRSILIYLTIIIVIISIYSFVFLFLMFKEGQHIPSQIENVNPITAIYWVIATMTTVGYGDVYFIGDAGRVFSSIVAISGVIFLFGLLFPLVLTPWLDARVRSMLPTRVPSKLSDHLIICGYSRMVESLIEELERHKTPFVVVESDETIIKELLGKGIPCIHGDPSDKDTLDGANIQTANCLITNESDEMDANTILTAREMSDLKIIAILEDLSKREYLEYAGASNVIAPKSMLGSFIGRKAVDPTVSHLVGATEFLKDVEIIEFPIYPKSELIGTSLKDARIRARTGCNIIGMWAGGEISLNLEPTDVIKSNSILLAVGTEAQLLKLKKLVR
uniref:Calcium-gated potassium channel MthK n=1 Tax=Candidatus Methanogaster sp. ANME-2c ERB4 TaxID=2759911 RepID=A0A7G9Y7A3_9EURY|nr:calcium-gated potassium channel MthK [Methanosarcinales archaeon ANME-2c ERB4]QNO43887.1 calcium-gated potassium channel MthK [Methanosarcinales archaeon ANME-2c ERB4]